jgi:hypothetical protein
MRIAEKVGAVLECIARNRLVVRGMPQLTAVYSMVPGDAGIADLP